MKLTIALLLLMPCWAWACLPFNQPDVSTRAVRVATPAGEAYGYLCKVATNKTTRQDLWVPETFAVLNKHRDPAKFVVASARAAASAVPEVAYAEVRAGSVSPASGSMDEYEFKRLHHLACVEAAKLGPANSMPVTCEAAPTPPVVRWVVAKAAANASPTGVPVGQRHALHVEQRPRCAGHAMQSGGGQARRRHRLLRRERPHRSGGGVREAVMPARRGVVADHEAMENAIDPLHVERVLPDYTWPWRMPLDALRRLVERESQRAIQEANNSHLRTP
jgi:hypothetical protein